MTLYVSIQAVLLMFLLELLRKPLGLNDRLILGILFWTTVLGMAGCFLFKRMGIL